MSSFTSETVDAAAEVVSLSASLNNAFGGGAGATSSSNAKVSSPKQQQQPNNQPTKQQQQQQQQQKKRAPVGIYPVYLESSATVAEGRRLPRSLTTGCDQINFYDICDAATTLGFVPGVSLWVEPKKLYPRAVFPMTLMNPGRVRVALRAGQDGSGALHAIGIESKEALLRALAKIIPTLESRQKRNLQRDEAVRQQQAAILEQRAKQGLPPPPQMAAAAPSPQAVVGKKGKGKK